MCREHESLGVWWRLRSARIRSRLKPPPRADLRRGSNSASAEFHKSDGIADLLSSTPKHIHPSHPGERHATARDTTTRKKVAMTPAHKEALAQGRVEGRAIRAYLEALDAQTPKHGRTGRLTQSGRTWQKSMPRWPTPMRSPESTSSRSRKDWDRRGYLAHCTSSTTGVRRDPTRSSRPTSNRSISTVGLRTDPTSYDRVPGLAVAPNSPGVVHAVLPSPTTLSRRRPLQGCACPALVKQLRR